MAPTVLGRLLTPRVGVGSLGGDRLAPSLPLARLKRAAGQSVVELALIVPVLTLILLGIIDLGRVFYTYEALANAAREGARYCALNQLRPDGTPNPDKTIGTIARITNELDGRVTANTSSTICASTPAGQPVNVSVEAAFTPITPIIGSVPINLRASATMVVWK